MFAAHAETIKSKFLLVTGGRLMLALVLCLMIACFAPTANAGDKDFIYHQSSGQLTLGGTIVGTGYSGKGDGKNNPNREMEKNVGPIPHGLYRIGKAREWRGMANVFDLTPEGHNALGRTEFLIHGDSKKNPGNASEGCIILSAEVRKKIGESGITKLLVVKN